DGLARVGPLLNRAEQLRFRPIEAKARLQQAQLLLLLLKYPEARASLNAAVLAAEAAGAVEVASEAHLWLLDLDIDEMHFDAGPEHPSLAGTLINFGGSLSADGKYDQAIAVLERALAIKEKTVGPDHPHITSTLNNLADAYVGKKDYQRGVIFGERAVAMAER